VQKVVEITAWNFERIFPFDGIDCVDDETLFVETKSVREKLHADECDDEQVQKKNEQKTFHFF
jgi:hypothetical protein